MGTGANHHQLTGRLSWYSQRLRSMSAREMLWRSTRLARDAMPRVRLGPAPITRLLLPGGWETAYDGFREARDRPVLLDRSRAAGIAEANPSYVASVVDAAERVSSGRIGYFGYPEVKLGTTVDWNHDPVADVHWPRHASRKIDHRSAKADPKWIWELNRLQHLPWLAQAWLFTGQDRFAETALRHLESWMDQNPVGRGIAWRGAFEVGVRSISVAVALQGLRDYDALTVTRYERVVRMLAAGAEQCWRERSRFSSANNHLVGELAGLAVVSMLHPELRVSSRCEPRAVTGLTVEASRQILPDGAGAEQAIAYQVFTAELLLVVSALLRARGDAPPEGMVTAIDRSADYLAALVGQADPPPRYGDDDEGFALRLGVEPLRNIRDHLGMVSALTGNERAGRAGRASVSSLWLATLPGASGKAPSTKAAEGDHDLVAPSGGLVVLRTSGRRLTMDVGPLGYLSIAAHGHADALALSLAVDGQELIGDPGTGSYYGHPEWRAAHRSTRVHGTVSVDGEDQSVMAGPFMWSRHATVSAHALDLNRGIVDAEHDGYQRLACPVTHRRWLIAPPGDPTVVVVDLLHGEGRHVMCASWPLHPSLDVIPASAGHEVSRHGAPVLAIAYGGTRPVLVDQVRGDQRSHLGWWSERLEARTPSWLLSATSQGEVPMVLTTLLRAAPHGAGAVGDVTSQIDGRKINIRWLEAGRVRGYEIDTEHGGCVREVGTSSLGASDIR